MPDRVYDSRTIANYLIGKAAPRGGLDPLQVMKLCYIAHGFTLALTGRPLIEDDVEAWKLGPVVRRVYDHIPGGSTAIVTPPASFPKIADLEDGERGVVDDVFAKYGQFGGL